MKKIILAAFAVSALGLSLVACGPAPQGGLTREQVRAETKAYLDACRAKPANSDPNCPQKDGPN
jgi:hypothetical protein